MIYGDQIVLKLYRRLEEGLSLDLEMGRFLTDHGFANTPAVLGAIEYVRDGAPRTIAVLQRFIRNEGDAWELTRDSIEAFFENTAAAGDPPPVTRLDTRSLLHGAADPAEATNRIGTYAEDARILGQRTAELHVVLASEQDDPAFRPEPFTMFYQRALYQSMRNLAGRVFQQLATRVDTLSEPARDAARELLELETPLLDRLRAIGNQKMSGLRIRCHGDYHLGQVLYTGKDFYITDFEGEPIRPLSERRMKRSPLRDVAGMLRSFHYAAQARVLEQRAESAGTAGATGPDRPHLEAWARFWYAAVSTFFLEAYMATASSGRLLPETEDEVCLLLDASLLEKAIYELGYELNNRPEWAGIPLAALLELLRE